MNDLHAPGARHDPPRIGFYGLLGSGNLGNDGALEAMLEFVREHHPDALVGCLCPGPATVRERYAIPATPMQWVHTRRPSASWVVEAAAKAGGKLLDVLRTVAWVRRCDVVLVPGAGVLESTLPTRPWRLPFAMFLLGLAARLSGTRMALVSVGANVPRGRLTRWLYATAARLADYRSFRDAASREALGRMGVDTAGDAIYPDLVFAVPAPEPPEAPDATVGIGVMDFHGGDEDRARADELRANYVAAMTRFTATLTDRGHSVRLFIGDLVDEGVAEDIIREIGRSRAPAPAVRVTLARSRTLTELLRDMSTVDSIVATRYHNVVCALMLGKPTVSVGYAAKNDRVMAQMGLGAYCQHAGAIDVDRLTEQHAEVRRRADELRPGMLARVRANRDAVRSQQRELSHWLLTGPCKRRIHRRRR